MTHGSLMNAGKGAVAAILGAQSIMELFISSEPYVMSITEARTPAYTEIDPLDRPNPSTHRYKILIDFAINYAIANNILIKLEWKCCHIL